MASHLILIIMLWLCVVWFLVCDIMMTIMILSMIDFSTVIYTLLWWFIARVLLDGYLKRESLVTPATLL